MKKPFKCSICNVNFITKNQKKIEEHIKTVHGEKNHSNAVFAMLISLQKNQTKIEEHIKTVHGEIKHSNAVFAMPISLQKNQAKIEEHIKTVHSNVIFAMPIS